MWAEVRTATWVLRFADACAGSTKAAATAIAASSTTPNLFCTEPPPFTNPSLVLGQGGCITAGVRRSSAIGRSFSGRRVSNCDETTPRGALAPPEGRGGAGRGAGPQRDERAAASAPHGEAEGGAGRRPGRRPPPPRRVRGRSRAGPPASQG